ncbi:hypothetical protein [Nostoc sp.]|uniref:hypothetical protein n=1 Tax=Nostoc sp. TaxID=1180 RepID=UPI002FF4D7A6
MQVVEVRSLIIPLNRHTVPNRNPLLPKFRQQFLNHNPQSRVIRPALHKKLDAWVFS